MAARHRSRQRALQVLYQWDMTKRPMEETIHAFYDTLRAEGAPEAAEEPDDQDQPSSDPPSEGRDPFLSRDERDLFMEELVNGASAMAPAIDHRISEKSAHWKLERMPIVDRNILRLAIYEMSRQDTPAAVVIDEALELARQFSGDESVSFINGVLDAVHKDSPN
jgi:transcription antitermination protein NusB